MKFKRIITLVMIFMLSITLFTACKKSEIGSVELNISAASSLREAMPEIMEAYTNEHPNVSFIGTYDSSGTLQTQIESGAPCDVFISAATKQMSALDEGGFIETGSIVKLLLGKLVLIVPSNSNLNIKSFDDVSNNNVILVAIGDVAATPVGQYTKTVLTNLGIWDKVSLKVNYGTNVANVLAWVETGDVDCGFVYATDAATSDKVNVVCEAPKEAADLIIFPAAVTKTSLNKNEAESFVEFLSSGTAKAIFEKYGFEMYVE